MLKLVGDQAESRAAMPTADAIGASISKVDEEKTKSESSAAFTQKARAKLALAERQVPEINAQVELQRVLIGQLADVGKDTTSAEITLDSLLLSLFLAAEDRHRLRALLSSDRI